MEIDPLVEGGLTRKSCNTIMSELKSAFFALKVFCKKITNEHVKVFSDNTTTITYINNMGGSHLLHCNVLPREVWL